MPVKIGLYNTLSAHIYSKTYIGLLVYIGLHTNICFW